MAPLPNDGSILFSYVLTGAGWARADLHTRAGHTSISASYLSDALGQLLRAVDAVLGGAEHAEARWQEEPGQFRWVFHREEYNVRLEISAESGTSGIWFGPEFDSDRERLDRPTGASTHWVLIESVIDTSAVIARAITDGAEDTLIALGEFGYWAAWRAHAFPMSTLRSLQAELGIEPRHVPEQTDGRIDPILADLVRVWLGFLTKKITLNEFAEWAQSSFASWRDGITHQGLQIMNDTFLRGDLSQSGFGQSSMEFRRWSAEARAYAARTDEWNRRYWMDYLEKVTAGVSAETSARLGRTLVGTLSESDIERILAKRVRTNRADAANAGELDREQLG